MNCKFCNAELEEGSTLCPVCGKENAEETPLEQTEQEIPAVEIVEAAEGPAAEPAEMPVLQTGENAQTEEAEGSCGEETSEEAADVCDTSEKKAKPKAWKIVLAVACGVVLLGVLVFAVLYGLGIDLKPRENDLYYKESYTVLDEEADKWSDVVVATAGDRKLTNGELQLYYWSGVMDFLSNYSYYLSTFGLDYTKPLDQQMYFDQDITWQQFFLEGALDSWHRYTALVMEAEASGHTLNESDQEYIDSLPEQMEQMAQIYGYEDAQALLVDDMGALSTMDGYLNYMSTYYLALNYFNSKYENIVPTDADVEAYFAEHEAELAEDGITKESGKYYDVRHILIEPEGGTTDESGNVTYSDVEWEACRAQAQALLDQWLADNGDEESFAELAYENSADTGSNTTGGLYTQLTTETNFVEEFKQWYLDESRQEGDTGLVKSVYGYHVMYFSGSQDIWEYTCTSAVIQERSDQLVEEAVEKVPLEVNYKKIALGEVDLAS